MEDTIFEILKAKGNLKKSKLLKKVSKQIENVDETAFDKILDKLVNDHHLMINDGEYCINKANKRKRESQESQESSKVIVTESGSKKVLTYPELWKNGEKFWREGTFDPEYLRTNPEKITRLFCGNLNKKVTEEELMGCLEGITYIKWITDKETGEFYGSSFLEMKDPQAAATAVMQDRTKFMGRPLKIYYCPPRPGDVWPPKDAYGGERGSKKPNVNQREKTPKPDGCRKLFIGNLSYDIDDDTIVNFFKDCGNMIGLRWLTHQLSGEFRGSGYVEFGSTEEADAAMALDGKELLGRKIRIDWTN